jgi:hypothetical protein
MWNRASATVSNHDIKNIKYFVSVQIINAATAWAIVPRALRAQGEHDGVKQWPGTSFQPFRKKGDNKDEEEAALALIGKLISLHHWPLITICPCDRLPEWPCRRILLAPTQEATWHEEHLERSGLRW